MQGQEFGEERELDRENRNRVEQRGQGPEDAGCGDGGYADPILPAAFLPLQEDAAKSKRNKNSKLRKEGSFPMSIKNTSVQGGPIGKKRNPSSLRTLPLALESHQVMLLLQEARGLYRQST